MHLSQLRLRDFRNYTKLDVEFSPGFHLFLGANAQGKTNILESIYLLATLRSFRGATSAQMVREQQKGYFVGAKVVGIGEHEIKIYWSARDRQLTLDGRRIRKLTEYLGVFRAVIFCSEDLQLVKAGAEVRRRFLDLLLAQADAQYLTMLQRYTRALRSRNALLKSRSQDEIALESFTRELIEVGTQIMEKRRAMVARFTIIAAAAFSRISNQQEVLRLEYVPSVKKDFVVELSQNRVRERVLRTTVIGPHRDDLRLMLDDRLTNQFGSEGQKRSVVLALKMAQAEHLEIVDGRPPILLIDDVMGELDRHRRRAFLPLLERIHHAHSQVFMTCTEENWPTELGARLIRWDVRQGSIRLRQ